MKIPTRALSLAPRSLTRHPYPFHRPPLLPLSPLSHCPPIHSTLYPTSALIESTICYDIPGHAFVLEDAIEVNNTFRSNLGVLVRPVPPGPRRLLPSDEEPAVFWITYAHNTFEGARGGRGLDAPIR